MADNLARLEAQPAVHGHPLKREIEVDHAGVVITLLLTTPHKGAHLLRIEELEEP